MGLADGLVTNLAFLTGFSGAVSSDSLIRFAGVAAMLAGTVSMFFGGFLSARSEHDLFKADAAREAYEMENEADEEKWELKWIYMEKGLTEQEADMVVARLLTNKEKFMEDMLANELHVHEHNLQNPLQAREQSSGSLSSIGSFVPLAPYYLFSSKVVRRGASLWWRPWSSCSSPESGKGHIVKQKPSEEQARDDAHRGR